MTSESHGKPLSDVDPGTVTDSGRTARTDAYSGPHGVVQAILDVTPTSELGHVITSFQNNRWNTRRWGDPAPIAAKQAAAVLRWLAADVAVLGYLPHNALVALADEVEAAGTDNTTRQDT